MDPKTGVKKALTRNGKWFDTFEVGSKNGIATQSGDEDDTFEADAPLADATDGYHLVVAVAPAVLSPHR